jgi:DNA-binding winged helix-turn-helix (wHTH) protein
MDANAAASLIWLSQSHEVVVLRWPADAAEVERLDRANVPRLLLVEHDAVPPESGSCLEDWVWLPADDAEVQLRLVALAKRAMVHPPRPTVDTGQLTHRDRSLFLSPIDQRIVQVLVDHFGSVVTEEKLLTSVWPDGATSLALRVHVSRLRRQVAPLGLSITCVRNTGYLMSATVSEPSKDASPES